MVESLNTQSTEGYILRHISVSCPECQCGFSAPSIIEIPAVTEYDTIEADLHRVLPDAELRGTLIAVCPHCNYATWTVRFRASGLNPEMLPDAAELPHTKKFALAVKYAREKGVSPLDIAFIALNGLYCARESGEDSDLWLELAAYEQSRGIAEESIVPATGADYLIMAELWRQLGSFENAIAAYQQALEDDFIPRELVDQQTKLCHEGNITPTVLPPYMVRDIFPNASELTDRVPVAKAGRAVPTNIERRPKPDKLEMVNFGPPERRPALSASVADEPIPAGISADDNQPIEVSVEKGIQAEPAPAAVPQPAVAAAAAKSIEEMSVAKVRQIIAQPQGASAIYLVQAAQVPQIGNDKPVKERRRSTDNANATGNGNGNGNGKGKKRPAERQPQADPLPKIEMPANEYFAGAASPNGGHQDANAVAQAKDNANTKLSPMQRALNKAMRNKKEVTQEGDRFPEIQLTDEEAEESYARQYDGYEGAQDSDDEFGIDEEQQPAAAQQTAAAANGDFTNAVAQVESFLNLRRQPSYQNWIRSHRQ